MRVRPIYDEAGHLAGLEIPNLLLTRAQACRIVAAIPGVTVLRKSRLFRDCDQFCKFEMHQETLVIEEPFGDNSAYFITRLTDSMGAALQEVADAFRSHRWWKSPFGVGLVVALLAAALAISSQIRIFIAQDACLNGGGKWESGESRCTKQ